MLAFSDSLHLYVFASDGVHLYAVKMESIFIVLRFQFDCCFIGILLIISSLW